MNIKSELSQCDRYRVWILGIGEIIYGVDSQYKENPRLRTIIVRFIGRTFNLISTD